MIQRDFILRLIDQLGEFLRELFGTGSGATIVEKQDFNVAEAEGALEKSCQQALGLSLQTIRDMAPDEVVQLFRSGGATWSSRCFFAARIFEFEAQIAARNKELERARLSAERALYFYSLLRSNPEVPAAYQVEERVETVTKFLGEAISSR
jgi:hypothetical protein